MKFTFLKTTFLLFVMVFLWNSKSTAQSIGFDVGIAGAQNYGEPNAAFGFSVNMPFGANFEGVFSIYKWRGEDDNYTLTKKHNSAGTNYWYGTFYGNKGTSLLVNYKYFSSDRLALLCGAGFSQFEMLEMPGLPEAQTKYYGAVTIVPLNVKYHLSGRVSLYTRGSLSAKVTKFVPDWGLLNMGIEARIF